jgi:hypothetical protein
MWTMMEVSLRQIIQAIREGPLPKAYQSFFEFDVIDTDHVEIVAADALGNAAIVLGVDADELYETLVDIETVDIFYGDKIEDWNDNLENYSLEQIADMAEKQFASDLDKVFLLRNHIAYIKTAPNRYIREFNLGNDEK